VNKATPPKTLPTVAGFAVGCAIAALREQGVPVRPLLEKVGLSQPDFSVPQRRVSAAAQGEFLEVAAEAMSDTAFALHLAERCDPREIGLLFYVASAAKTFGEALTLFARYFRIVNESVRFALSRQPERLIVEFNLVGVSQQRVKQNTEFWLALIIKAAREVTGRDVAPIKVICPHTREENQEEFERFFGCPVEFGAALGQLIFSNETAALPMKTEDPHLLELLQPFCEQAEKSRNTSADSFRASVENVVERLLPHAQTEAKKVAEMLGISVGALSRKLAKEGTTFVEVVDQVRRSLALQYLVEPSFTLTQIAWLLGYQRPTSFKQAFRRWTGQSPSAIRGKKRPPWPI